MLESSSVKDRMNALDNYVSNLKEGWALPRERKTVRFTSKQIDFLTQKFDEGLKTSTRWKPEVVVDMMHNFKVDGKFAFSVSEFLSAAQIRSVFSREKSKRAKVGVKVQKTADEEEQDDEESFRDGQALEEVLVRSAMHEKCEKIFDEGDEEEAQPLKRGVKHHSSNQDLPDKKRSSLRKKKP
ncbi:unnamed protein product [Didymodactylos carnosus]|uniref:Uncharacterized protein n=1 Tax=Didymodactylos carnosus TaxID=1234261 RepID=A0A814XA76_9BILA|nr:unnamed protein product [Didymodactylos carnosus]CAF3977015.1 unnamed protein product [Didymodactylos carnosus]